MQVLLAGTAARVPTSSSDGKRKTKKKKTKWSSHRTESSPISCWDDFTEAGQRRPKSQPHCDCRGAPTTHNPLQLFLFFNQWHGWKKKKKKRCLAPTMHAVLQHNVMHDSEEEGKKQKNKTKAKVKFPVYRFACVLTLCCTSRAGRPSFCFFFFFFLNTV